MTSQRVFISYRSQNPDLSLAQEFYQQLKAAGHKPFLAAETIRLGENWVERIDRALESSDYLLLLLSEQSATSEMVTEEVRRARELQGRHPEGKPIILPIRVNFPFNAPLNYDLRSYLQRIQQREWKSAADSPVILREILDLLAEGKIPEQVEPIPTLPASDDSPDAPPLPIAEPELLREPGGAVSPVSSLYIERPPIEAECFREVLQSGSLIRIKAPRQMGKTSLMGRILNYAKENDCQAIPLTFQRASSRVFDDLDSLLRWFCEQVGRKLKQLDKLEEYWSSTGTKNDACYYYFEECLLEELDTPLVLGLDEFDRVLVEPHLANDFCGLLRAWNEASRSGDSSSEQWEKLRLIIVHSTEIYGALDIKQSPLCNVGKTVDLPEFNESQIQKLAALYGLRGSPVTAIQQMVGGHPYLLRKAFYELRQPNVTLEQLLAEAPTDAGIYSDHLRRHLLNVQRNPALAAALRQVVKRSTPTQIDSILAFQLDSMGLIERQENQVMPRCELYRQYFFKHLI
jgi:serine/threonine-protein kinase